MKKLIGLTAAIGLLSGSCRDTIPGGIRQSKTGESGYELVKDWPSLPAGTLLGSPTGMGIDSDQNVFVFHRADRVWPLLMPMPSKLIRANTILLLDGKTGKLLNSWGAGLFRMPHGLTVDRHNNLWVTDVGLHQVFQFSHEGRLLMKLGIAGVPGNDTAHFNRPTDVAVAADGSFYVSDGYRNSRVVKFSSTGQYLFEWGRKGSGTGEFNIPHSIELDEQGNVYVADRENCRVQVFDARGKFLRQYADKTLGPLCAIRFDRVHQRLVAVDDRVHLMVLHRGSDILLFDSTGGLRARWGRSGAYEGPRTWYHDLAIDREGNIYVGDILNNRIQKYSITDKR